MPFDLATARPLLARTPLVLDVLLRGLPESWVSGHEGAGTWSPREVLAHLIHGERTDWIPRTEHLLAHGEAVPFPPFDRFATLETAGSADLGMLLDTFAAARGASLGRLDALGLRPADLSRSGRHPAFGRVTLGQHLASWVVHDLDHLVQIARVMGRQYEEAVGPWSAYLRIVNGS